MPQCVRQPDKLHFIRLGSGSKSADGEVQLYARVLATRRLVLGAEAAEQVREVQWPESGAYSRTAADPANPTDPCTSEPSTSDPERPDPCASTGSCRVLERALHYVR